MSSKVNIEELKNKARKKNPKAQYELAILYKEGKHIEKDMDQYKKWIQESANNNGVDAFYEMGNILLNGIGVEKNEEGAMSWFVSAVKQGHVESHYKVAKILINGLVKNEELKDLSEDSNEGLSKKLISAEKLLRIAANKKSSNAQYELGMLYQLGLDGLEKDYQEAERWLVESANSGHLDAMNALGYLYAYGSEDKKIKKNLNEAVKYWKSAAEQGNPEAQYNLANYYVKEAINYWEKSAMSGNEKSKFMLIQMESYNLDK